mmetsp:Transcript_129797/g.361666  ORF Transcript_129797/g.361666 Transcript_129797/m.361666 type:complete len:358 (+) Transcript_129797:80-1153(+)
MAGAAESISDGTNNIAFLRITLLGASGSGKSTLANAFVNNIFLHEHNPTTDLTLYYARCTLRDDDDTDNSSFHCMVEIEDTWACNRVAPDKMLSLYDPWWPYSQREAMEASRMDKKGEGTQHKEGKNVLKPFSASMPPELWGVACKRDHTLKLEALPASSWICERQKDGTGCKSGLTNKSNTRGMPRYRCEACDYNLCEKCHKSRLEVMTGRNPDPMDIDREGRKYRPLTRNRMVYFLVFDMNDSVSYQEAVSQEKALRQFLTSKKMKMHPITFLVGTKKDIDPDSDQFKSVRHSAKVKSEKEAIRFEEVSALKFEGVKKLFRQAVQAVRGHQALWLLDHGITNVDDEDRKEGCCAQ